LFAHHDVVPGCEKETIEQRTTGSVRSCPHAVDESSAGGIVSQFIGQCEAQPPRHLPTGTYPQHECPRCFDDHCFEIDRTPGYACPLTQGPAIQGEWLLHSFNRYWLLVVTAPAGLSETHLENPGEDVVWRSRDRDATRHTHMYVGRDFVTENWRQDLIWCGSPEPRTDSRKCCRRESRRSCQFESLLWRYS
jgi:hypothetical protein